MMDRIIFEMSIVHGTRNSDSPSQYNDACKRGRTENNFGLDIKEMVKRIY